MKRKIRRRCKCGCGGITRPGRIWIQGHNANIIKNCLYCGARIELKIKRDMRRKKFCGRSCQAKYGWEVGKLGFDWDDPVKKEGIRKKLRGVHSITQKLLDAAKERGLKKRGIRFKAIEVMCEHCGKTFITTRYRDNPGNGNKHTRKYCCVECKNLASRKLPELRTNKIRLKEWRMGVLARDDYICQHCGCERKRLLQAHHKKSKTEYPELIYEISNGETLCVYCHIKQHPKLKNFILSSLGIKLKQPYVRTIKRREGRLQDACAI